MPINDPLQSEQVKQMGILMVLMHDISTYFAILITFDALTQHVRPFWSYGHKSWMQCSRRVVPIAKYHLGYLQLIHPTIMLILDHFSALTMNVHIHFIIHVIPQ